MQLNHLLVELKRVLNPEDLSVVVAALRHDALVWEKLEQPEFFSKALAVANNQPELWNPATMALVALNQDIPLVTLRSLPLQPLPAETRQLAARTYEETYRTGNLPGSLEQAGYLALALRERRRLTETWQGLLNELQLNASKTPVTVDVWFTPIACLVAMAPDVEDLLAALLPSDVGAASANQINLVLHALLSNPFSVDEHVSRLTDLLAGVSVEGQLTWLEHIQVLGENELTAKLASALLRSSSVKSLFEKLDRPYAKKTGEDPIYSTFSFEVIAARQQLARLYQYSGHPDEAQPLFETARNHLRQIEANVSFEMGKVAAERKDLELELSANEQTYLLLPDSPLARSKYADVLSLRGRSDEAVKLIAVDSEYLPNQLISARISTASGNLPAAREKLGELTSTLVDPPTRQANQQIWIELAQALFDLNLFEDAMQVSERGLQYFPTSVPLLKILSQAIRSTGEPSTAARIAGLAVALEPRDIPLRRLLADTLDQAEEWDNCLEERNQVLVMNPIPNESDLLSTAASAVKARRPEQAITACQAVLDRDPDQGMAHDYYGEALAIRGDIPAAVQHLSQATLLAPERSEPWIALSSLYSKTGNLRKALEVLRSAAHAAPDNSEIHLALGQACLSQGLPSDALPALRRAADLAPEKPSVSLGLAQTLYELGHLDQARKVLDQACYVWPMQPELALLRAKTLIGLDELPGAIPALETVLHSQPKTSEPYLLFGRTMVNLAERREVDPTIQLDLASARKALLKALEFDPENYEARLLMAEAHAAFGDLQAALDTYVELSEMTKANDPSWNWRIHLGMGKVAMALGQMDTAIAALQEAIQSRPDDLRIHHALAEAYHAAKLSEEAIIKARTALGMAPHNIANLTWYARMALLLKDEGEAITALEHAVELAPERTDLKNQLAHVHLQINDQHAARRILDSVLTLESAPASDLRQTSTHFMSLGDKGSAQACLVKAIENSEQPCADLWAELAVLYNQTDDIPAAQNAIEHALEIRPRDPALHTLRGNLFASLDYQTAINSYEQALEDLQAGVKVSSSPTSYPWSYIPTNVDIAQLHLDIAKLMRENGDYRSALEHAEQVTIIDPENVAARNMAAEAAFSLLELDCAVELAAWPYSVESTFEDNGSPSGNALIGNTDPKVALQLFNLQTELFLEIDDNEAATQSLSQAKTFAQDDARILASQARLAARQGAMLEGVNDLERAISVLNKSGDQLVDTYPTLPIAEAALELQDWNTALPLFQQAARNFPLDPFAQLSLARAITIAAEAQQVYTKSGSSTHAPGEEALSESSYQQFEQAILAANRLSSSEVVSRWHKRGQAVFHPAEKTLKALKGVASTAGDLAALLSAGESAKRIVPVELVSKFSDHPAVLIQKSLSLIHDEPEEAFLSAQSLINAQPGNPLNAAILAQTASNVGNYPLAYQSIQAALSLWPDEPTWQALAAKLAKQTGQYNNSLIHWKSALELEPGNTEFQRALGTAYLQVGDSASAIQTLKLAAEADPASLEVWTSLAQAYRAAGNYPQGVACAEKAIQIAPDETGPRLLSGEIALAAGQTELARTRASSVLEDNPNQPQAILLVARALTHDGQPQSAIQTLDEAIANVSEPFELLLERTRLVREIQGPAAALIAIQALSDQYPEEPQVLAELASALAEAGQKDPAEKAAQAALVLQPDMPGLHLLLGRIQHLNGQLDQSIHHLSEAIQQQPRNIDAYIELGKVYQDRREHQQALKVYEQASKVSPQDPRPYYQSGLAFKEMKDYESAEAVLRRGAELAPDDISIRRQLAAIIAINLVHKPKEAPVNQ